jgi:hypothetical protein
LCLISFYPFQETEPERFYALRKGLNNMVNEPIEVFELTRLLIASVPWLFSAEVIFRSVFMFVFALIIMRLLGRRAVDQLTSFDLLIIIALGSAMGDPMFYPVSLSCGQSLQSEPLQYVTGYRQFL